MKYVSAVHSQTDVSAIVVSAPYVTPHFQGHRLHSKFKWKTLSSS